MSSPWPHRRIRTWLRDAFLRRLLKNSGWLLGGTGLATAIGLIGLTLKTHSLGAENFGLLTVVLAYITLAEKLTSFRSWMPFIKFGADAIKLNNKRLLAGYAKLAFLMDAAGALLGFAFALLGARLFASWQGWDPQTVALLTMASFLVPFNLIDAPTGILRTLNRFRFFTFQKIAEASLGMAGALLAWYFEWGITGFLLSTILAILLGRLLLIALAFDALRREGILVHWKCPLPADRGRFLRFGWWSYLSGVMDIPVKQLDVIILSATLSLEASGIYRIIKQVVNLLMLMTDPIYQAVYPQFAGLMAEGDFKKSLKYCAKIGILIAVAISPISLVLAATSKWWLGWTFGPEFTSGWGALTMFLLLKILTLPTMPLHPLFTAAGHVRKNVWILGASNGIYLLLLSPLTLATGLFGPILAWFIQSTMTAGLKLAYLLRHSSEHHRIS